MVSRRASRIIAPLLLVVLVAVGCSSSGFPVGYDDQVDPETGLSNVEENWLEGCRVGLEEDLAAEANAICSCSYSRIKSTIPFEAFVEADDRLSDNPEALTELSLDASNAEAQIVDIVRDCIAEA